MKGSGLFSLLSTLFIFLAFTSAWPWPGSADADSNALILRRQEQKASETAAETAAASTDDAAATTAAASDSASASASASVSDSASASASASGTSASGTKKSGSKSGTKTTATKTTAIDPRLPPGGISLITPAATDGIQFYRVGENVTFQWNYTSLSVTPSAIDVLASCSLNQATYTISANMSVDPTGAITWDTGNFPEAITSPFAVASYTLIVHDAASDITDVPSAGYLGAYDQYVFGMYTGQAYTPLNEFKCATCNGAFSVHEKQVFGVVLMTAAITVMSFTWFANGFGVFS
ncbi:hypothetical protein LTR99_003593 [Exophiala xenobiotica]|uniref:DUF7137 domain-containing protein n=1 Tax=Vermiconidia calcicola TaxID=1690605 RepID=A0AAV9PYP1_9PEZI|nr:hypothetical protein LTR92_008752 [Exophiala xenobiotica]KAK5531288.1 hypothetical protein LTR25_008395 [Vermiconidia calcicola]KAK5540647.1 hypothetical protein LTR23_006108 [Chaetothyriales sp. CCFEE 6169]KAK5218403.1 hypothetical protein LTR72_009006 [Exophiala xenobiotica]KAK5264285.1 hypothetical protein LTR96_010302 [Exophiala xenobiotica]